MSEYVPVDLRRRVRDAFFSCCAYCQTDEALTVATFEIEHITPISTGGATEFENLCLACPACNRFKSNRTRLITGAGHEVSLFHPQQENWPDHFDWSVDGTVIVGLTEVTQATIKTLRMNWQQAVDVRALWVDAGRHPPK
ncbi:HNH endonuclease [Novipirellula sp. SH528]|uniref:HNH endonuclease n=1 Tax=Novipirellula sp. SH528 TaxID=3454466 RepID=UPI003F9FFC41